MMPTERNKPPEKAPVRESSVLFSLKAADLMGMLPAIMTIANIINIPPVFIKASVYKSSI